MASKGFLPHTRQTDRSAATGGGPRDGQQGPAVSGIIGTHTWRYSFFG